MPAPRKYPLELREHAVRMGGFNWPSQHLDRAGIAASIGTVGDAYDNSLMESTIGLFKTELIKPRRPWKTLSEVELATAEWVDWYCHRRLHGEIGHTPPVEYETNYYRETRKTQVTVKI
ncbi:integrase core domain-containing protein [Streptomyces sp. NPDC054766]